MPWGSGLSELGPTENRANPLPSELNNPSIEPICREYTELRYRLMPYTYTLAWEARTTGMPFMRALWLHYPADVKVRDMGDQYLWGKDMLIAPVYKKGAVSREVYLPEGLWYDWWTNEQITGSKTVTKNVDLKTMPIYVKAGAIIIMDPVKQYTSEVVNAPVTVRIFTGDSGSFELYEDDGISQEYLEGTYSLTKFSWDNKKMTLSITPVQENGVKPAARSMVIELLPAGTKKTIQWNGKPLKVKMK